LAAVVALATSTMGGCGGDDEVAGAPLCANPATAVAFPSPAWHQGDNLSPPPGDGAAAMIAEARPVWLEQMAQLDGWPRLPDIVVPLSGPASGVDAAQLSLFVADADGWRRIEDASFDLRHETDPPSLIARPQLPFAPGSHEVIVGFGAGAATGAQPLAACGADGQPHPDYATAAAELPPDAKVELALRIKLARANDMLPALGQTLEGSPVLSVESVEARDLDSFGDAAPPTAAKAVLAATAAAGVLALPDYRGTASAFDLDADGLPIAAGTTRPGFIVALPATGTAPFPFVLFQHGGGQDKVDFFQLAEPLAAAGFAFVAIDLPVHGNRAGSGGGGDLDFLLFDDPLATRENFRQAVADHMAVLTGIEALNAALAPVLGVSDALDPDRSFYVGLSLGGISGSLTFASSPRLQAGALFVAGAGYSELVSHGVFSVLFNDVLQRPPVASAVVLGALATLLDGADPASYGRHIEDRSQAARPALFMQAIDDTIVSMSTNDRLAGSYGAALALPSHHSVEGMTELSLPASDNFSWDAGGAKATRVLVHNPMAEQTAAERHGALIALDYSQRLVAHCFSTLLASGSCEVIDTDFDAH
jgi:dienelactone hydrolase